MAKQTINFISEWKRTIKSLDENSSRDLVIQEFMSGIKTKAECWLKVMRLSE